MKKYFLFLMFVFNIGNLVALNLVVFNHTDYDINYTIFAHTSQQQCGTYQSGNILTAFGGEIGNIHSSFSDSSPFWYYYQNGSTNSTVSPPTQLAIWDYVKFWSNNTPCYVFGSVGNGCSGTANSFYSSCLTAYWSTNANGSQRVDFY